VTTAAELDGDTLELSSSNNAALGMTGVTM